MTVKYEKADSTNTTKKKNAGIYFPKTCDGSDKKKRHSFQF